MRLIFTSNDQKQAQALSSFLTAKGIENHLDVAKETDWGHHTYGDIICRVWVIDEDQVEPATGWVEAFRRDPSISLQPRSNPQHITIETNEDHPFKFVNQPPPNPQVVIMEPLGKITLYILLLCSILFLATSLTEPSFTAYPSSLPPTPLFSAPIKKQLLYDYPHAYEIVDKLVKLYGIERLQNPADLPAEGQLLFAQFQQTPYWQGYYDIILNHLQGNPPLQTQQVPMFEKISEGEVWRLISPCFLHSDILHILFNMIWLIILGKQLEQRLQAPRYLLFILLTGVFSNTAQYLMGGANFIGFSGVVCGMLAFIWVRQKTSAWEGYQLDRSTLLFVSFFVLSMFTLQLISFYLEANNQTAISPGIANTAHLSGAVMGYILARIPYFNWKA